MQFGMPFLLETKSVKEAIALAKELDLDFIELNTNFPVSQVENLSVDELSEAQESEKLSFSLHLDDSISIADFNPFVRQAYLDTTLQAIQFCKQVGIPTINIHFAKGNIVTLPDGKHFLFAYYKKEFHENLSRFRNLVETEIADSGIRLAVENTDGWDAYEREGIELLLESPVFGLCMDIGHNHAVENKDLDFIEKHKDRLIHMHAHDGWDKVNHQAFGSGEIPLLERLDLAKVAGASVVIETKTIEALRTSVKWLKKNYTI